MFRALLIVLSIFSKEVFGNSFEGFSFLNAFNNLGPNPSIEDSQSAVEGLIKRLLGNQSEFFNVTVDPSLKIDSIDLFQINKDVEDKIVRVRGTTGVAVAWGVHHYLKEYCMCHISWDSDLINIPPVLPPASETVRSNDRFRYYQNVCTTSYSFVWWDWRRWEREIDWMALNGFNLALAFNGQEAIWRQVYLELGFVEEEIGLHFSGPAFLSWNRMGNMRGWGGPLTEAWHEKSIQLQRKILSRMRALGITPVLPSFAGHVPRAFSRVFPNASLTLLPDWNGFSDEYCCPYLLSPEDKTFNLIGSKFLKAYITVFGTDHIYNCDPFNEMTPSSGNPEYLQRVGREIFRSMTTTDPDAVWMLQGWMFKHDLIFWTESRAKAMLTSIPIGKFLILDLQAELTPQYERLNSFFGQPYIWCMLHNFGGTLGMHGSIENINKDIFKARESINSTMVGTGITPEGIYQNYVVYDLLIEMFWRKEPVDLTQWFRNYSIRRYGQINEHNFIAWSYLKDSVYNYSGVLSIHGKYIVVRHPQLKLKSMTWYNRSYVFEAWNEFLLAANEMEHHPETFRIDLVDLTRQALQLKIDEIFESIQISFNDKNITKFQEYAESFLSVLDDMENILASNSKYLLGNWISSAAAQANSPLEERIYIRNAKNQITLWGPNGEIKDYANKQWSGMMKDYYKPRWEIFLASLNYSLVNNVPFRQKEVSRKIFEQVEQPFTYSDTTYTVKPTGDTIGISKFIYGRWGE